MRAKAQSAMEYLMTYGWAILIIAVVLGALFELGIFNATGPRAQAGSCEVYRPYGPGTAAGISLAGECNNYMPDFVGSFPNSPIVTISDTPFQLQAFTLAGWFYWTGKNSDSGTCVPQCYGIAGDRQWEGYYGWGIDLQVGQDASATPITFNTGTGSSQKEVTSSSVIEPGKWYFVAVTDSGTGTAVIYINGVQKGTGTVASQISYTSDCGKGNIWQSGCGGNNYLFLGELANIQLYNSSLSAAEVQSLYIEGIGGAPQVIQNLVGWWPLNGDANDYSGNNNDGLAKGVTFTGQWTSGYTAP